MPDLRRTRKNLTTAIAVMVGLDLLAAVLYFSPLIGSPESRRQNLNRLQADLAVKTREVAPLKDLPHKVVVANQQITDFYKNRFPSQNSQIYAEFGKLAAANGVRIETVGYKPDTEGNVVEGLQAIEMDADLAGTYTSLARFINALERDEMFFIINTVTLGNDPKGPVKLSVRLETYLKTGTT
jgi:type IV pilus assembly protein PilO